MNFFIFLHFFIVTIYISCYVFNPESDLVLFTSNLFMLLIGYKFLSRENYIISNWLILLLMFVFAFTTLSISVLNTNTLFSLTVLALIYYVFKKGVKKARLN